MRKNHRQEITAENNLESVNLNLDKIFEQRGIELEIIDTIPDIELVRAHFCDDDGDMGYVDDARFVGLAKLKWPGGMVTYVAEEQYPHKSGSPTYFYEYEPNTKDLRVVKNVSGKTSDLSVEERDSKFLSLTADFINASSADRYEIWAGKDHDFRIMALQD